jgi:hypothetical protein
MSEADKQTPIERALQRAYDKKDVPRFVKIMNKLMSLSENKDSGSGAEIFRFAIAEIKHKEDSRYNRIMKGEHND